MDMLKRRRNYGMDEKLHPTENYGIQNHLSWGGGY